MSSDERLHELVDTGLIDEPIFNQLLDMDDAVDDPFFSKGLVFDFFDQAKSTFDKMDKALQNKELIELSNLGHFLKGSSATLGLVQLKESCEKMQNIGKNLDETGTLPEPDDNVCLKKLDRIIKQAKEEFEDVKTALKRFYND